MCGIAGFIDFRDSTKEAVLSAMIGTLSHRGPDKQSLWMHQNPKATVGLAHSRLSIIDLSDSAFQPMHFEYLSIVFNGEVYNYKEIRDELSALGHTFITSSDTEVVLHSFYEWGTKAIDKFIGMFAIVLFDHKKKKVLFVRDRVGVKPLFIYRKDHLVLFASELKAFHEHPGFLKEINPTAVHQFFSNGYIKQSNCIYNNCSKLLPTHYMTLDVESNEWSKHKYWDPSTYLDLPKFALSDYHDVKTELTALLKNAFSYRMIADVPVGVFLSGGYDSSAVAALLQSEYSQKLKTFTIGFEYGNNEAPDAKKIAEFLGTEHSETICTEAEAQSIIADLPYFYDEPFGDSSAIPTILVSRMAKQQVTVALSADGGDEIFGGYNSYSKLLNYHRKLDLFPAYLHPAFSKMLSVMEQILPHENQALHHKISGMKEFFRAPGADKSMTLFANMSKTPEVLLKKSLSNYDEKLMTNNQCKNQYNLFDTAMLYDYTNYMTDDILVKVDRATMSASLEGREPFLDHRIWQYAARMPENFKRQNSHGKLILKDIVHDIIPKELMERPKTGFSVPVYKWLRKELSYLIDEYLNERSLAQSGFFDVKYCKKQVTLFKTGDFQYTPYIWYLLMFQMWYNRWMR
jgi:asparagine synthase (glutamine-hydrolysing)